MLDITKKVWEMLLQEATTEEMLKVCSYSSLCKIRANFNKQKRQGMIQRTPSKFPQKSRRVKMKEEKIEIHSNNGDSGKPMDISWMSDKGIEILKKMHTGEAKTKAGKNNKDYKHGGLIGELQGGYIKKLNSGGFINLGKKTPPKNYPEVGKPDVKVEENFEKGETSFDVKSYEINTLEQLIAWTKIDMDKFDCASFTANRWGNAKWECTQCKAVFKPKVRKAMTPEEIAEIFHELVESQSNKLPVHNLFIDPVRTDITSIMPIADFHFGALALKQEIGHENNLEVARENMLRSMRFHLNSIKGFRLDKIIIPVLGDFYNTDTPNNTTTRGTFQEETTSWKSTSRKGCELMIEVIDLCRREAMCPVKVVICNGNHDLMRSFALGLVLEAYYRDDLTVEINNSDTTRKYELYGNSIFGFGHGDTKANADYLGIMCEESPVMFAKAKHRTMLVGHLHHKVVEEKPGIVVRRVGSLTSSDAWHKKNGYQSVRSSESYIVDRRDGIISNSTFYLK